MIKVFFFLHIIKKVFCFEGLYGLLPSTCVKRVGVEMLLKENFTDYFLSSIVIANAACFQDIEADWNWLAKYLLETLGKLTMKPVTLTHQLLRCRQ